MTWRSTIYCLLQLMKLMKNIDIKSYKKDYMKINEEEEEWMIERASRLMIFWGKRIWSKDSQFIVIGIDEKFGGKVLHRNGWRRRINDCRSK